MIYCVVLLLFNQGRCDDGAFMAIAHEFGWGSDADEATEAAVNVLLDHGVLVRSVLSRCIASDQDLRGYPIPEMIHGLPWHLVENAPREKRLN